MHKEIKTYGGGYITQCILVLALDGGGYSASRPAYFDPGDGATGIHRTGNWLGSSASLDTLPLQPLSRPTD
jgi:hypothetical protein